MHSCINHKKSCNNKGYGVVWYLGKKWLAHRAAWHKAYGDIPQGLCVCHKCDNRKCINVDHLFLGTPKDNTDDMIKKGRQKYAEEFKNANCKLSNQEVKEIRRLYSLGGHTHRSLAQCYGVNHRLIGRILSGEERRNA